MKTIFAIIALVAIIGSASAGTYNFLRVATYDYGNAKVTTEEKTDPVMSMLLNEEDKVVVTVTTQFIAAMLVGAMNPVDAGTEGIFQFFNASDANGKVIAVGFAKLKDNAAMVIIGPELEQVKGEARKVTAL